MVLGVCERNDSAICASVPTPPHFFLPLCLMSERSDSANDASEATLPYVELYVACCVRVK